MQRRTIRLFRDAARFSIQLFNCQAGDQHTGDSWFVHPVVLSGQQFPIQAPRLRSQLEELAQLALGLFFRSVIGTNFRSILAGYKSATGTRAWPAPVRYATASPQVLWDWPEQFDQV